MKCYRNRSGTRSSREKWRERRCGGNRARQSMINVDAESIIDRLNSDHTDLCHPHRDTEGSGERVGE